VLDDQHSHGATLRGRACRRCIGIRIRGGNASFGWLSGVSFRLTVYGCEPDEADRFATLAERSDVVLTFVVDPVSTTNAGVAAGHRCASVGHKTKVTAPTLRALRAAGVEHLSTRSIGVDHVDVDAAEALGITVEAVGYDPDGVADFTVLLVLMAIRT